MNRLIFILLFFLLGKADVFSQEISRAQFLERNAESAAKMLQTNPEEMLRETNKILQEARVIHAEKAELICLKNLTNYWKINNNFEKMMDQAELMYQKAEAYKNPIYQVMAKRFISESYMFSGLMERAFPELEQAQILMRKFDDRDSLSFSTKADLYITFSNYYDLKGMSEKKLYYTKLAGEQIQKIRNEKFRDLSLYIYYSNMGLAYNELQKMDSARYYFEKSLASEKGYQRTDIQFSNFSSLGEVYLRQNNYDEAVHYFKKAERINGHKNHLNLQNLYKNIIKAYSTIQKEDSAKFYQAKKDSLDLLIAKSQNKSLNKLLVHDKRKESSLYQYGLILCILIICVLLFFVRRKNKILSQQEEKSYQYLEENTSEPKGEEYAMLIKMLHDNDPSFMFFFNKAYPDFTTKLKSINPKISTTDLEFCCLLKLNLTTKDISTYRFLEPQSVRNKKYLIRKKLSIPKDCDIYEWFSNI